MFYIDETKCAGCGNCIKVCQQSAVSLINQKANINNKLCNECGLCYEICPNRAVAEIKLPENSYQETSKTLQTKTNNVVSIGSRHSGLVTALAGIIPTICNLFASMLQNRDSAAQGRQYNQRANRRGKGFGQRRRGCKKGKFF